MASDIVMSYKVGLKHQIVDAAKSVFGPSLSDERYRDVYIGLEYPLEQINYPAIYISYSEGPIRNVGVGHLQAGTDSNSAPVAIKHYRFEGTINFNILAMNPLDRDNLSAILINLLSLGDQMDEFQLFYERLEDEKFIPIQMNPNSIQPSGEQVGAAPWAPDDERVFGNQYRVPVIGEFFSEPKTGKLIVISAVDLFPYRFDQPSPW